MGYNYLWAATFDDDDETAITQPIKLGDCDFKCTGCDARFWEAERLVSDGSVPFVCCGKSVKVEAGELTRFSAITDEAIRDLYYGQTDDALHFRQNIRAYNRILSVASPIVKYKNTGLGRNRSVSVNGKVTFAAHAFPDFDQDGLPANHGQLYFLDMTDETVRKRIQCSTAQGLREHIVHQLEDYLRKNNKLIQTFEYAAEKQRLLNLERKDANHNDGSCPDDSPANVLVYVNVKKAGLRDTQR